MDAEGYIVYDIRTVFHGDTNYTTICGENEDILATLRWRDLFADEIMLPGRGDTSFSSVRRWLKKSILFRAEDRTHPIASFQRSRLFASTSGRAVRLKPTIELTEVGEEVRDLVVVSWVCLEKSRRVEHGNVPSRVMAGAAA
ncbi:hypothetical protein HWV62_41048 [Athelia sp. TMB]|nr:hypothetical protein HWV62_41048 [Athelia sp. TMB]